MGYKGSDADKAYRRQYIKEHSKRYSFPLYETKDKSMMEYLETKRPVGSYLKNLVKKDIESD